MADKAGGQSPTRAFLDADSAADDLVKSLDALREEAGTYVETAQLLDQAGGALVTAGHAVKGLTESVEAAVGSMGIHAKHIDKTHEQVDALRAQIEEHLQRQASHLDVASQTLTAVKSDFESKVDEAVSSAKQDLKSVRAEVETSLNQVQMAAAAQAKASADELRASLATTSGELVSAVTGAISTMESRASDAQKAVEAAVKQFELEAARTRSRVSVAVYCAGAAAATSVAALIVILVR